MTGGPSTGPVPAPPADLECSGFLLAAGTRLHRIHDDLFAPCVFNPGYGHSRFAPFEVGGVKIPTAYAATNLECAVYETIFHDIDATAPIKSVRWSALQPLRYSIVELKREVSLAALFSADLLKLGLERGQLIDTPKSTYPATQAWSPAIHGSPGAHDGMIWVSRKFDLEKAMMLFGDRIKAADWEVVESTWVTRDPETLRTVEELANRSGILIAR